MNKNTLVYSHYLDSEGVLKPVDPSVTFYSGICYGFKSAKQACLVFVFPKMPQSESKMQTNFIKTFFMPNMMLLLGKLKCPYVHISYNNFSSVVNNGQLLKSIIGIKTLQITLGKSFFFFLLFFSFLVLFVLDTVGRGIVVG